MDSMQERLVDLPTMVEDAHRSGLTTDQIRQRVRSGEWQRLRRGAFLLPGGNQDAAVNDFEVQRRRHVSTAVAAARVRKGTVIAYESAALVHGIPLLSPVTDEVELVTTSGRWTGTRAGVHVRRLHVPPGHLEYGAALVTTPARTWLDLACRGSFAQALAAGDFILCERLASPTELAGLVEFAQSVRLPGRRRAERALAYLDPLRESVLESCSCAYFVTNRIPLPRAQVEIHDSVGRLIARVDFLWKGRSAGHQVIGEADGRMKYERPDDLYAEKRREDRLRELGFSVVRWGFADLRTAQLAARLRQVLSS